MATPYRTLRDQMTPAAQAQAAAQAAALLAAMPAQDALPLAGACLLGCTGHEGPTWACMRRRLLHEDDA